MADDPQIILVNEEGHEIGTAGKFEVHKKGLLHQAFSILIFNSDGQLLTQRRNKHKYHSGGLWSNTVCGHPRSGEVISEEIHRRLWDEMGFDCELKNVGHLRYRTEFDNGLIENEYDFIFTGEYSGVVKPDLTELSDYRWVKVAVLEDEMQKIPSQFTSWFKQIILQKLYL